jgi:hypothetical protein
MNLQKTPNLGMNSVNGVAKSVVMATISEREQSLTSHGVASSPKSELATVQEMYILYSRAKQREI